MLSNQVQKILDQLSRNQTQAAMKDINQLIQKDKKKSKLTNIEHQQLSILKAQVLVMDKHYGEAQVIFDDVLKQKEFDNALLFLLMYQKYKMLRNVAKELNNISQVLPLMPQNDQSQLTDLLHLQIQDHRFSDAAKTATKLFNSSGKNDQFMFFCSIFFQGEAQPKDKGGKLALMFCQKLMGSLGISLDKSNFEGVNDIPLAKQVVSFLMEFYKQNKDVDNVKLLLKQYPTHFQVYQRELELHKWVWYYQQNEENFIIFTEVNLKLFRSHIQSAELFTQNFEAQVDFINQLFSMIDSQSHDAILDQIVLNVQIQQAFQIVSSNPQEILVQVYLSSFQSYQKSNDSMIIRSLILTCLKILDKLSTQSKFEKAEPQLKQMVASYFKICGHKFSFTSEILNAVQSFNKEQIINLILTSIQNQELEIKTESDVIRRLNVEKVKQHLGLTKELLSKLLAEYNLADQAIYQPNHHVEKGDRLTQDDYLLMVIDILLVSLFQTGRMKFLRQRDESRTVKLYTN